MNIYKKFVTLVMCVAVTAFVPGCVAADLGQLPMTPETFMPEEEFAVPDDYDEVVNWTNGDVLVEAQSFADQVGLEAILVPYESYVDLGYIGVSPLEDGCIVAFSQVGADLDRGEMSYVVLSRFDLDFSIVGEPGLTVERIKDELNQLRPQCAEIT